MERFAKEIKELKGGGEVSKQSHLKPLTPIVDELGVLRVGGRLNRAQLPYDAAHPMILPKKHHITRLVVADVHHRCRHAGVNHVLAQVRSRYWVIDGRQEVKNWDQECKSCERRRANHGTTPNVETGNANEGFCQVLCGLCWAVCHENNKKSICQEISVPLYLSCN